MCIRDSPWPQVGDGVRARGELKVGACTSFPSFTQVGYWRPGFSFYCKKGKRQRYTRPHK
eukprot:4349480-Alexandrium_andersonii.AAC.1